MVSSLWKLGPISGHTPTPEVFGTVSEGVPCGGNIEKELACL